MREKNRARQKRYYERQKEKLIAEHDENLTLGITSSNALDIDKDIDIDKDKKKSISKKPARHKYGEYQNVLLSDDDLNKLQAEFPADWGSRIERLSSYMASSGKSYKNHLATIRNWARRDKPSEKPAGGQDMTDLDKYF